MTMIRNIREYRHVPGIPSSSNIVAHDARISRHLQLGNQKGDHQQHQDDVDFVFNPHASQTLISPV
jgi:hypothetical protein